MSQGVVNLVLVLVQFMFASLAVVGKFVLPELPATGLIVIRVTGAALALLAVDRLVSRVPVRGARDWTMMAVLGLLGVGINQTFFLLGLSRTTAVNASILVTTIPVFTVLYSVLGRVERASALKIGGIVLAAAGAIYLIGPDRASLRPDLAVGNALIVIATMCFSGFLVLAQPLLRRYGTMRVSAYSMGFGAISALPMGLVTLSGMDLSTLSPVTWGWLAYIILIPTVLAYCLNAWALKRTSSQLVAAFIYLQPVFTVVVAPLVLEGEGLSPRTAAAGVAIFGGLGLVIWGAHRHRVSCPPPLMGE